MQLTVAVPDPVGAPRVVTASWSFDSRYEPAIQPVRIDWGDGSALVAVNYKPVTGLATTNLFTSAGHGLLAGDRVQFTGTTGGVPIVAGTDYYVIAAGLTANDFSVALTPGGTVVDVTTDMTAGTLVGLAAHKTYAVDGVYIVVARSNEVRLHKEIMIGKTAGMGPVFDPTKIDAHMEDRWARYRARDANIGRASALLGTPKQKLKKVPR